MNRIKKSKSLRISSWLAPFFMIGIIAAVAFVNTKSADASPDTSAFSNILPNPSDMSAGGISSGGIDLHFKKIINKRGELIANVNVNRMAAYYPNTDTSANGKSITILPGKKGKSCRIGSDVKGKLAVLIGIADKPLKKYTVPMNKICNTNQFYGHTFNFPSGTLRDDDSGFSKAGIRLEYEGVNFAEENAFNYRMQLTGDNSNNGVLALLQNDSADEFGLRSTWSNNSNDAANQRVAARVTFGYPCSITNGSDTVPKKRTVRLYDADTVFGDTYMWVTKDGKRLDRSGYKGRNPDDAGTRLQSFDRNTNRWKLKGSNTTSNTLILSESAISSNAVYQLVVYNDGNNKHNGYSPHQNTLSVGIPYDSIYGSRNCKYDLKPTVNPPTKSVGSVTQGDKISVQGHIDPNGFDSDKHDWYLTARVYSTKPPLSGATNNQRPCEWKAGNVLPCDKLERKQGDTFKSKLVKTAMQKYDTNKPEISGGDWVCFVMSVQRPTHKIGDKVRWRHSNLKCVQVQGNTTGVTVNPHTYSYYPKLAGDATVIGHGTYPYKDNFFGEIYGREYDWEIDEVKFKDLPNSIGGQKEGDNACDVIKDKNPGKILDNSCKKIKGGNNLFPVKKGDKEEGNVHESFDSKQKGPDPIGTWTCYTIRHLVNPPPSGKLLRRTKDYKKDYDDRDSNSAGPWGDGRYYIQPVYGPAPDYIQISPGHYNTDPLNLARVQKPYYDAIDYDPPKYTYTKFTENSCSLSGVNPKIQVRGGDIRVGGDVGTYLQHIPIGGYEDYYGSFGEYGVLAGGLNRLLGEVDDGPSMGSGMGEMLYGTSTDDQNEWSSLTFTNNEPLKFGNFDINDPKKPTIDNTTVFNGDHSFTSGTYLSEKKVYVVQGTATIKSDLKYADTYTSVSKLPRVVIIADNIEIDPGVERIDPWLITNTNGSLSTCSTVPLNTPMDSAKLDISKCGNPLVFNGPVYADKVFLYRTGGSRNKKDDFKNGWSNPDRKNPDAYCEDDDCENGKAALNAPAEVFNLRPDAFLSAFAGTPTSKPVVITDKVTELPPRF